MPTFNLLEVYIARDSISAAENVAGSLEHAFLKLSLNPYIGSLREDLTDKSVRFWLVHSYYIIYDPETNPLQILRVISSYRDIKTNY